VSHLFTNLSMALLRDFRNLSHPPPQLLWVMTAGVTTGTFCCLGVNLGHDVGDALEERREGGCRGTVGGLRYLPHPLSRSEETSSELFLFWGKS
jgi:hypothetical protein